MDKAKLIVGCMILLATLASVSSRAEDIEEIETISLLNQLNAEPQARLQEAMWLNNVEVSNNCSSFVTLDNQLGPNGVYIMNQLASGNYPELMSDDSLKTYCPRFPSMTVRQKSIMWVLVLTTMAHFESSCDPSQTAQGPNGVARGLFQLHQNHEAYYDGSKGTCVQGASYNSSQSIRCTLGMLELQIDNHGGKLIFDDSYWDVLRPDGVRYNGKRKYQWILEALRGSAACRQNNI